MATSVNTESVAKALQPWLGIVFISSCSIVDRITTILNSYSPSRNDFYALKLTINRCISNIIYEKTNGSMKIVLTEYSDEYSIVKCTKNDISEMTDDVMGVLFFSLTPIKENFQRLNEYACANKSLTALKTLFLLYKNFYNDQERTALKYCIQQNFPSYCYKAWMRQ